MPVGAGSIKRAAKLNAEGGKATEPKKAKAEVKDEGKEEAVEMKVQGEGAEGKTVETQAAEEKTAVKKSTAKKTTAKKPTKKTTSTKAIAAPKVIAEQTETAPKRLGSDPACHFTEEMPVYLL